MVPFGPRLVEKKKLKNVKKDVHLQTITKVVQVPVISWFQ